MSGFREVPRALSPEEWDGALADPMGWLAHAVESAEQGVGERDDWLHEAAAIANAALPEGDVRKITRADVEACAVGWGAGEGMHLLLNDDAADDAPHKQAARMFVAAAGRLSQVAEKLSALLPPAP